MRTIGIAVFCLLLGFFMGMNFDRSKSTPDSARDCAEQAIAKQVTTMVQELERAIAVLDAGDIDTGKAYCRILLQRCAMIRLHLPDETDETDMVTPSP